MTRQGVNYIGFICISHVSSCHTQGLRQTVSAPQYTTVHYVLMAASVFLFASLVLGILLLMKNDIGRRGGKPRRRQVIRVQPRPRPPSEPSVADDNDLIVEDLVDELFSTIASSKRPSMAK